MHSRRWFFIIPPGIIAAFLSGMIPFGPVSAAPPAGHKPRTWIPWSTIQAPGINVVRSHQAPTPGINVGETFWAHAVFVNGSYRPGYWAGDPLPAAKVWSWMPIKTGNFDFSKKATATATYVGQKMWVSASGEYLIPPDPVDSAGSFSQRVPTRQDLREELDMAVKTVRTDNDSDGLWDDWEVHYAYANKPGVPSPSDQPLFNPLTVFSAQGDWDNDGLSNATEFEHGLDPSLPDSDGDTVNDKVELDAGLDPLDQSDLGRDSDGDGLSDGLERILRLAAKHQLATVPGSVGNPYIAALATLNANSALDSDKDGLADDWEKVWGRNINTPEPRTRDEDGDGLTDILECRFHTWPSIPPGSLLPPLTPFCDYNSDGITDILQPEFNFVPVGYRRIQMSGWGTSNADPSQNRAEFWAPDPKNTDGDAMSDLEEVKIGRDPLALDDSSMTVDPRGNSVASSPGDIDGDGIANDADPDRDGDGVLDSKDEDKDGDGVLNSLEVSIGLNPDVQDVSADDDGDKVSNGVEAILKYSVQRLIQRAGSGWNQEQGIASIEHNGTPEWWYVGCLAMSKDVALDSDNDGLSDSWELVWDYNPMVSDRHGDETERFWYENSDDDELGNDVEYAYGTYPNFPCHRFKQQYDSTLCDYNSNGVLDVLEPPYGLMLKGFQPAALNLADTVFGVDGGPNLYRSASFRFEGSAPTYYGRKNTDGDSLSDAAEVAIYPTRNPRVWDDPVPAGGDFSTTLGYSLAKVFAGAAGRDENWYDPQAYPVIRMASLGQRLPQYESLFNPAAPQSVFPRYYATWYSGNQRIDPERPEERPPLISSLAWSHRTVYSDYSRMDYPPGGGGARPTNEIIQTSSAQFGHSFGSQVNGIGDVMRRVVVRAKRFSELLYDNPTPEGSPKALKYRRWKVAVEKEMVKNNWHTWQNPPALSTGLRGSLASDYIFPEVIGIWGLPGQGPSRYINTAYAEETVGEFAFEPSQSVASPSSLTGTNQRLGFESRIQGGKHVWKLNVSGAIKYRFNFGSNLRVFRAGADGTFGTGVANVVHCGKEYTDADLPNFRDDFTDSCQLLVVLEPGASLGLHHISVRGTFQIERFDSLVSPTEQTAEMELAGPDLALRTRDTQNPPSYRLQLSEDGGSRYRKIGLNGVPLGDGKPQTAGGDSNLEDDTYIDALNLTLNHRSSDIYVPIANSDLSISVARSLRQEKINSRMESDPLVHDGKVGDFMGRPFGLCWDASLTPHAVVQIDSTQSAGNPDMVTVTDESGASFRFAMVWSPATSSNSVKVPGFLPMPTVSDQTSLLNRLTIKPGSNYASQNPGTWELELTKRSGTITRFEFIGKVSGDDLENGPDSPGAPRTKYFFRCKAARSPAYTDWAVQDRFGNRLYYEYPATTGPLSGTTRISAAIIPISIFESPQRSRRLVIQTCNAASGLPAPERFISSVDIREKAVSGAETILQKTFYNYSFKNLRNEFFWPSQRGFEWILSPMSVLLTSVERQVLASPSNSGAPGNIVTKYVYDSKVDYEESPPEGYAIEHAYIWLRKIEDKEGGYVEFRTDFDRSRQKYVSASRFENGVNPAFVADGRYDPEYGLDRTITEVLQKGPGEQTPHLLSEMRLQYDGRGDLGPVKIETKQGVAGPASVSGERVNAVVDADRRIRFYRFSAPLIRDTEAFQNMFFPPGINENGMPEYRDRIGLLTWRKMEIDHGLGAKETYEFDPEAMMGLKSATMQMPGSGGGAETSTTTWKYESAFRPGDFIPFLNGKTDNAGRPLAENPFFCRWYPEPSEERRVLQGSNSLSVPGNGAVIQKRYRYWGDDRPGIVGASLKPWARTKVKTTLLVDNVPQTVTETPVDENTGLLLSETVKGPDGAGSEWSVLSEVHYYYGLPPADPFSTNSMPVPFAYGTKAFMWRKVVHRGVSDSETGNGNAALITISIPDRFYNVAKTITGNTASDPAKAGTVEYTQYNALGQITAKADGRVGLPDAQIPGNLALSAYATKFFYRLDGRLDYTILPSVQAEAAFPAGENTSGRFSTKYVYDNLGRKRQEVQADGSHTEYEYDHYGRVAVTTAKFTDGTPDLVNSTSYSPSGLVAESIAPNGLKTEFQYDWLRRITRQTTTDVGGPIPETVVTNEYSGVNCGNSLFTSSGFQPTSASGPFVFANGKAATKLAVYDSLNRKLSEKVEYSPGLFAETKWGYDAQGHPIAVVDPEGRTTSTAYDGMGRAVRIQKPDGGSTLTLYSGAGLPLRVTQRIPAVSDGVTAFPDRTRSTATVYDAAGRVAKTFPPDPVTGSVSLVYANYSKYNLAGQVSEVQVPLPGGGVAVTNTEYDNRGRVIKVIQPPVPDYTGAVVGAFPNVPPMSRPKTSNAYDRMNRVTRVTDARGGTALTVYNQAGQAVRTVSAAIPVSTEAAGATGSVITVMGRVLSRTVYDKGGQPVRVSSGKVLPIIPDASAFLAARDYPPQRETDALQLGDTRNSYDRRGRLLTSTRKATPAGGEITESFTYDVAGNRTEVKDGLNQRTQFTYDALGRSLTTVHGVGTANNTTTNFYSATKLLRTVDAEGKETSFDYDAGYRLSGVRYTANSIPVAPTGVDQNQRYHYNAAGELLRAEFSGNPWRDSIYRYDARGRRIRETSVGQDHQYFYDELGNVTKMIHGGTLRCITSTYDALNRLQTCTETAKGEPLTSGRVTRYNYDLAGNILRKWLPSNMAEYKIFDAGGRCTTTIFTQVNRTLLHPSQTKSAWDAFGNLIWQQDERTAAGAVAAVSQRTLNRYDGLNRLTDELTYAGQSTSASQSDSYAYDAANNRTSLIRKAGSAAPVVLNYDFSIATLAPHLAANQAIQYAPNQLRRITKVTNGVDSVVAEFRYDKNGNRLSKWEVAADGPSIASYAWDRANRLVRVDRTGGNAGTETWRFGYDHRTRRILRNDPGAGLEMVSFAGGTSANTWQVAGDTPTKTLAAPQLSAEYIRGSDFGGGVGGILYSINGPSSTVGGGVGASRMYEYGARGDVTGLSDSSGATTFRSVYQAFGNHVDSGVAGAGRQRASTKEEESALGLLNEGFRHRDIATGVFLSRDPAGFVDGPNLYAYCRQNPWSGFDPDGLTWNPFTSQFWTEGAQANAERAVNAMGAVTDWVVNHDQPGIVENFMVAPEKTMRDTAGGIQDGLGKAALAVPAALVNANASVETFTNRAMGSALGIPDSDLEATDLRSSTTKAVANVFSQAQSANTAATGWTGGDPSSPTFQSASQIAAFTAMMAVPELLGGSGSSEVFAANRGMGWKPTPFIQCFPAGTMILMSDGKTKPIEEIIEGDEVLADDPDDTAPASSKRVTHLHRNWTERFIHVVIDSNTDGKADSTIRATGEHPFWTINRGWVSAKDLVQSDQLTTPEKRVPVVISAESVPTIEDTYNFTVAGTHTYFAFAGETPVLVHNADPIVEFDVRPYSQFRAFPGDGLTGHEILQNSWLKSNGYTGSTRMGANPSVALDDNFHSSVVNSLQRDAGLHNPSFLRGQSAYGNIRMNISVLESAGVPRDVIAAQARAARNFAKSLPCP